LLALGPRLVYVPFLGRGAPHEEVVVTNEKILELIEHVAGERDGKKTLACQDAFFLAEENGLEPLDIGRVCNLNNIRIVRCQLGCFK